MAGQERFFAYTKAVVCDIPASLPGAALRMDSTGDPVDLNNARRQHQEYVKVNNSRYHTNGEQTGLAMFTLRHRIVVCCPPGRGVLC